MYFFIQVSPITESLVSDYENEIPQLSNTSGVGISNHIHENASSYSGRNKIQEPNTIQVKSTKGCNN